MTIKPRVHRVGIAVENMEASLLTYSHLMDARFLRAGEAVTGPSGLSVAASWEAGIELVSPLPGRNETPAKMVRRFLDTRGEGVFALICETGDIAAAERRGSTTGLAVAQRIHFTDEQLQKELGGRFNCFEETVYDSIEQLGFSLVFNLMRRA